MPLPLNVFMTGSASGIGFAITDALARRGDRVFATDIDLPALQARAAAAGWGSKVKLGFLDVRDSAAWETIFSQAAAELGYIDVEMNVPGAMCACWIHETTDENIQAQVDVNIKGVIFGTRTAARHMIPRGAGHIVNIGSLAGLLPTPGMTVYSGTKYAVRGFSLAAGRELKRHGVRVTLVCPDAVNTPLLHIPHIKDAQGALAFSGLRILEPEEVARAVVNRVLVRRPPMIVIPAWRGWMAKSAEAFPRLTDLIFPLLIRFCRSRQKRLKDF